MKKILYLLTFYCCLLFQNQSALAVVSVTKHPINAQTFKERQLQLKKAFRTEKKIARLERFLHRFSSLDMSDSTQKWLYLSIFTFIAAVLLQLLYKAITFSALISLANTFFVIAVIFFAVWLIKKYA